MSLNLADRIAILAVIRPRVKAAVLNFALYILGEATNTVNHANRLAWARDTLRAGGGEQATESLLPYMLNEPNYLDNGSSVTDVQITGHVETAIVNHYISPP